MTTVCLSNRREEPVYFIEKDLRDFIRVEFRKTIGQFLDFHTYDDVQYLVDNMPLHSFAGGHCA